MPNCRLPIDGFGAPVANWLRGPLREWAEALLDESRLRAEGHFDARVVRGLWGEFLRGQRKWHTHLWNVLMFQAWREQYRRGTTSSAVAVMPEPLPAIGPERVARAQYGC